mgnify:CR=1 FL=1
MNITIEIDGKKIGPGQPPYIVAELSANHNGSKDIAIESIRAAKRAGVIRSLLRETSSSLMSMLARYTKTSTLPFRAAR